MDERKKDSVTKVNGNSSTTEKSKNVIDQDLCSSPVSEQDGTRLGYIFCLKTRENIRKIEEREDCFILEFDPGDISGPSVSRNLANVDTSSDLSVIDEKGPVACRDYPHSRHVCLKYPFEKTPHEIYCKLCYCFVCDLAAPCKKWTGTSCHCHAIDNEGWRFKRKEMRKLFGTAG